MEISEIKSRLSLERVLDHYNLTPDHNHRLKCPFHDDKIPSLQVYPQTGTWTCFSSNCSAGSGDQIDFIMKYEHITKHEAIMQAEKLCGMEPVHVNETKPEKSKLTTEINNSQAAEALSKAAVLTKIFNSFRNGMQRCQGGRQYAESRGLDPERLEIGYNSGQFHHNGKVSDHLVKSFVKYGILKPGVKGGYQVFGKGGICFALRNHEGQVAGLYFRSIFESNGDPNQGRHFYLKDRQGLYPGYPMENTRTLILTEAVIDAATLLQIDEITRENSILALYGTNGLTQEHRQAIEELEQLQEVIFFFDGDQAGREAIKRHAETLQSLKKEIRITYVDTPDGQDVNSLYLSHDKEVFTHLLQSRKPVISEKKDFSFLPAGAAEQAGSIEKKKEFTKAPENRLNTSNPEYITWQARELLFTLLGGVNLYQLDRLRVTVKITRNPPVNPYHSIRHTLDLYNDDILEKFTQRAAEKLEIETRIVSQGLAELTEELESYRLSHIESLKAKKPKQRELTAERRSRAIDYLKAPRLMERTMRDLGLTGVVGEETNRMLMYLVFTSRLRQQPLHIISLGTSGSGKTYLQEKISELIPEQDKLEITILSENAFYYFDQRELKNKLVLIEDMDGAENVLYPLRELQTKRRISKTIPIKDNKGNLKTITLQVEGPICLAGTTTRERLYEDNANRSLLIYLDTTREHKEQIMEYQRKLSAGKINTKQEHDLKELFRDMQTLFRSVGVRNPYAEELKIPEYVFKPLRTNNHYLAFIETVTFYHQWQREVKTDQSTGEQYIETALEDIRWANELLREVLLVKSDELPKAVRDFFEGLKYHLKLKGRESFYAREIRSHLRINPMTINRYVRELEARSFIRRSGGNRKAGFEYEIASWDDYSRLQSGVKVLEEIYYNLESKYNRSVTMRDVTLTPSEMPAS